MHRSLAAALLTLALAAPLACGGGDDSTDDTAAVEATEDAGGDTAASTTAPSAAAEAPNDVTAPITAEDFDRYERGLAAEVATVRKAINDKKGAKSSQDSLAVIFAATEGETQDDGARAAGVSVDRYRHLDQELGATISARVMSPAMRQTMPDSAAIAQLPAEHQEQARKNMREMQAALSDSATYRRIPPALQETFKARAAARLDTLWKELFALRMQAAGIAR
jgi:hypothetical protein